MRWILRSALPVALSSIVWGLGARLDVLLVAALSTATETALYDVAVRLVEATAFLAIAVCGPALFLLSKRLGAGDAVGAGNAFRSALRLLYLLAIPVALVCLMRGRDIASLAFGGAFIDAGPAIAVLALGLPFQHVAVLQSTFAMAAGDMLVVVARSAAAVTVMLVLDIALIPTMGAVGAAVAAAVSSTALAGFWHACWPGAMASSPPCRGGGCSPRPRRWGSHCWAPGPPGWCPPLPSPASCSRRRPGSPGR